jgi:predicted ATPase
MAVIKPHLVPSAIGSRPIILLEGATGSGKTRLLEECRALVDTQRSAVLLARGQPYLVNQPFGVLVEAIRYLTRSDPRMAQALVAHLSPAEIRAIAPLVPDLARVSLAAAEESLGEVRRGLIADALVKVLLDCGDGKPVMVLVDDLHWCDAGSLEVLQRLKASVEGEAVLVVAALCHCLRLSR